MTGIEGDRRSWVERREVRALLYVGAACQVAFWVLFAVGVRSWIVIALWVPMMVAIAVRIAVQRRSDREGDRLREGADRALGDR